MESVWSYKKGIDKNILKGKNVINIEEYIKRYDNN